MKSTLMERQRAVCVCVCVCLAVCLDLRIPVLILESVDRFFIFQNSLRHSLNKVGSVSLRKAMWRIGLTFILLDYPNSLTPFYSKTALLWRFNFADNNKTYLVLHIFARLSANLDFLNGFS